MSEGQAEQLQRLLKTEMPYGKYKGRLLADLPGHYLGWFAREGFPRGDLGRLLALMHEIDHNDLRGLLAPLRAGPADEVTESVAVVGARSIPKNA
jgi:uncharacterized protein (DUF3820 family)